MNWFDNVREWFNTRYHTLNASIYRGQQAVGRIYSRYFTLYASLLAALVTGGFLGFTGDDCYGKIPFDSPVFWTMALAAAFFFFQTFILIQLTAGRILRLLTVAVCGHYLFYQGYGFWSLNNVEAIESRIGSKTYSQAMKIINETAVIDAINGVGVCKPFAFANIIYGHIWLNAPAIVIILICFFVGNTQKEIQY